MNKPDKCACGRKAVVGIGSKPIRMFCLACFNIHMDIEIKKFRDLIANSPLNPNPIKRKGEFNNGIKTSV